MIDRWNALTTTRCVPQTKPLRTSVLGSTRATSTLEALIGQCLTTEVKVPDRVRRQGLDGAAAFLPPQRGNLIECDRLPNNRRQESRRSAESLAPP